jgi:transcriptional regulator with XRE-family HTH domain
MEKPNKSLYGYEDAGRGDDGQGGWTIEGGEQAYYNALAEYEESKNVPCEKPLSLGEAVKSLREKRGLTQEQLSKSVGCHIDILHRIENDEPCRANVFLSALSSALNIPLAILSWIALKNDDIEESKKDAFAVLKPSMDEMIKEFFI